ncbi:glutamate synthase subunit beta [Spirochaeta cellobiosiphila]|uniref:glutamate synthase subunit beta n=1 Tax=Spirochaeta cellobiosiphila TaxID=504483 RepID=UPI000404C268|nr:glutamate synthase subunit beta [Spirochaeta cellobiosiphila]
MGKPTGFLEFERQGVIDRNPVERIKDFKEFHLSLSEAERQKQGARCMDCGVPFCHSSYGCPVHNLIPEWNDMIFKGQWKEAYIRLKKTNNFPEFTGRVCPAPCESACVLGINKPAVTIKDNEVTIIDHAWREGWVSPRLPQVRTGKKVAVVGSGPSGLAAADQLNQAGHEVTVYERSDRIGGLLMYGIPNMKLDKDVVQRRIDVMAQEGVVFQTNVCVGKDKDANELAKENDAVLLACGATKPRDLAVPGRDFSGVHYAMDFLSGVTKSLLDSKLTDNQCINVKGKKVIVIGGGDTGNDCIGTSVRQGAEQVINFELMPKPANERTEEFPWPTYPRLFKVDYGHAESTEAYGRDPREYCILTKEFVGNDKGELVGLKTVRVAWEKASDGRWNMTEVENSEEYWEADYVFLALGFVGPEESIVKDLGIDQDQRSNVKAEYGDFHTSKDKIYACGDMRRGQSLVVWAINEGRGAAKIIDNDLMGKTLLP